MKHTLFMIVATAVGVAGAFTHGPFVAVAVYYLFAVLRPQFLWEWSLPAGIGWSQYVALAALVTTLLAALGMTRSDDKPLWHFGARAHLPVIAFFGWLSVSYVFAIDQATAWPWFLEYMKIMAMYLVAITAVRTRAHIWTLFIIATVAVCYIAYEINMVYVQFNYLTIWRRGYGGLDNNGAGLIMAMGVPMALAAWEGSTRWWRYVYLVMVVFLLHAVLMSYSRGAMLSLIVASPLIGALSRQRRRFGVAALALLLLLPFLAGREIRERFFSIQQYEADGSAQSRLGSWGAALQIAVDYPLTGAGIRCSNLLSYSYGADMEGRTIHSQYLQIAADNGFVGLGFYALSIAAFFLAALRARVWLRRTQRDDDIRATAVANGLIGTMTVFCVGATFLSLEVFELPFLLLLLGAQLESILRRESPNSGAVGVLPAETVVPEAIAPWAARHA